MPTELTLNEQQTLIRALAGVLAREAGAVQMYETHISWVLVAGEDAYKFKKAVRFDFLDFSSLDARRFYCHEELRLNRRLASDLYRDVVAVTGTIDAPFIGVAGVPIEYAVKMRAFAQQSLWSERIAQRTLTMADVEQLAVKLAQFHASAAVASGDAAWGTPATLQRLADDTLAAIAARLGADEDRRRIDHLAAWQNSRITALAATFMERRARGFVRECHGDLHVGNILTIGDRVEAFDCIEFSPALRWIDVIDDLAFIVMELQMHGLPRHAARLLNRYLESSGDYEGLAVLDFYRMQRALVRCKVALLRRDQSSAGRPASTEANEPESTAVVAEVMRYLACACNIMTQAQAAIILMHGFSGSGKSTAALQLVDCLNAIRLRSDVERKRLHGSDRPPAAVGDGIYDAAASDATYARLQALAAVAVAAGRVAVIDAAFLERHRRDAFRQLATELGVPLLIVDVMLPEPLLRARIADRRLAGTDPSDADAAVLAHQLAYHDRLADEEFAEVVRVCGNEAFDPTRESAACKAVTARLNQVIPATARTWTSQDRMLQGIARNGT